MKTVCKKLLCLMLVAMMLISAVPFAFADEAAETDLFWIEIRVDGEGKASKQFTMPVNPDADTVLAYAKDDAEYGAYFAEYNDYAVEELAASSAAINFLTADEPAEEPTIEAPADEAEATETAED